MDDSIQAALLLSAGISGVTLLSFYRWARRAGDPYEIFAIVTGVSLAIEYCLRPLAIATSGEIGWDPSTIRNVVQADSDSIAFASVVSPLCVVLFVLVVRGLSQKGVARDPKPTDQGTTCAGVVDAGTVRTGAPILLLSTCAVASVLFGLTYGGFGAAFSGEFGRAQIQSGYLYALSNLASAGILMVLSMETRATLRKRSVRYALCLTAVTAISVYGLILGGRAELITLGVGALVLVRTRLHLPRTRTVLVCVAIAVLASSMYRVATRETQYPSNIGYSGAQLIERSLPNPLSLVTRGDVSSFDKLVVVHEGGRGVPAGSTYWAAALAPIPGPAAELGLEGGNRAFTRLYLPTRFSLGRTFEGISAAGEGVLNFGVLGAPLVYTLLAAVMALVLNRRHRSYLPIAVALGVFPSAIRADALNTVALILAFTLPLVSAGLLRRLFPAERSRARRGNRKTEISRV